MKVVIAAQEPHLQGAVAPQFEAAPYYLMVDTLTCRTAVFPHPVQYQLECSPAGLVQRLRQFAPEVVVAGSFSVEVRQAASTLRIPLHLAQGRAAEAVDCCAGAGRSKMAAVELEPTTSGS